jgi:protein pelota
LTYPLDIEVVEMEEREEKERLEREAGLTGEDDVADGVGEGL